MTVLSYAVQYILVAYFIHSSLYFLILYFYLAPLSFLLNFFFFFCGCSLNEALGAHISTGEKMCLWPFSFAILLPTLILSDFVVHDSFA